MTIKEQIEIARLIASGTPREVAITEVSVIDKKSIVKSGPTIDVKAKDMGTEITAQDKAKQRLAKVRQAAQKAKQKAKHQSESRFRRIPASILIRNS